MMNKDIFVKLLQERRYKSVKDVLDVMNAVDIASLLGEFDDKELALAFRLIPKEKAADVFANGVTRSTPKTVGITDKSVA